MRADCATAELTDCPALVQGWPLGLSSRRDETKDPKARPPSAVRSVPARRVPGDHTEDTMTIEVTPPKHGECSVKVVQ